MKINMFEWNAIDLHTHTVEGVTRNKKKDTVKFNYSLFQEAVANHNLKLIAPTNHNKIDITNYLLMRYIGEIQGCNVLLGVELDAKLSMGSPIHIAAIVEQDLLKNISLARYINQKTEEKKNSKTEEIIFDDCEIIHLFQENNLLLIPHGDKDKGIFKNAGPEQIQEALKKINEGFIRICDSKSNWKLEQIKNYLSEMNESNLDDFGGVLFSDNRDWNKYDTGFRDFYMNAEPTFQGLIHAISNPTKRFCLGKEIKKNNNYISKIVFKNKNENAQIAEGEIRLSPYMNCIIGKSGSGKSLLNYLIEKNLSRTFDDNNNYKFSDETEVKLYNENGVELNSDNINFSKGSNIYTEIIQATTSQENNDLYAIAKDLNPNFVGREQFNKFISNYKTRIDEYCNLVNSLKENKELLTQKVVTFNSNLKKLNELSSVSVFPVEVIAKVDNTYIKEDVDFIKNLNLDDFKNGISKYKGKYQKEIYAKIQELEKLLSLAKLDTNATFYDDVLTNLKISAFNHAVNLINKTISSQASEKSSISHNIPEERRLIVSLIKEIYLTEIKEQCFDLSINLKDINSEKTISVDKTVVVREILFEEDFNINEKDNSIFHTHGYKNRLTNSWYNLLSFKESKQLIKKYIETGVIDVSGNWSFKQNFEPKTTILFDGQDVKSLNPGSIAKKYIEIYFNDRVMNSKFSVVTFDQIENDVDKPFIAETIKELLEKTKGNTQTIVITHDPIVAVNTDPNNYIECKKENNKIHYRNFVAESNKKDELTTISRIVDGSKEMIRKRYEIYEGENV